MDIHKLIDVVDKLNTKLSDLEKIEAAKKQVIEDVNRDIAKSRQLLEDKARGLEKVVENKLNELKKLDDELLKSQALLAKMNNTQNSNHPNTVDSNTQPGNNQATIKLDHEPETSLKGRKLRPDIMNSSLEDFIAQKFQEEYKVKYPENDNFRLTDKDFETVLFAIKEKAKQSNNLPEIIDEYLSSYAQTLHSSQIKLLEQEKSQSLAK
jgi:prophage DNA circulation protein